LANGYLRLAPQLSRPRASMDEFKELIGYGDVLALQARCAGT
jgi:hypothetical protein